MKLELAESVLSFPISYSGGESLVVDNMADARAVTPLHQMASVEPQIYAGDLQLARYDTTSSIR